MTNPFDEIPQKNENAPEQPILRQDTEPILRQEPNPIYRDDFQNRPEQPVNYGAPAQGSYPGSGYCPPQGPASTLGNGGEKPPKRKKNVGMIVFIVLLCLAILAGIVGLSVALSKKNSDGKDDGNNKSPSSSQSDNNGSPNLNSADSPNPPTNKKGSDELTAVGVSDLVKNSMVGITAYNAQSGLSGFGGQEESSAAGEGSGVLVSEDKAGGYSYIVTCAHVIDGSGYSFRVELANGETVEAQRVGMDSQTDIGVLRIKKTGLTLATFGDSDALKVGQQVIAIGNPGGSAFFGSVTQGIVSAIDRPIDSQIGYTTKCIQHDAAINPGNSGGGLFNMYGQLIGINSSKISSTAYEGMGFAVPSTTVKSVVNDLISKGYVGGRVMIGIESRSLSSYQNYYKYVQAGVPKGAVVVSKIFAESDLNNTQVKQFDIIAGINGKQLDSTETLNSILSTCKVGDTVTLDMIRIENNKLNKFTVQCKLVENRN